MYKYMIVSVLVLAIFADFIGMVDFVKKKKSSFYSYAPSSPEQPAAKPRPFRSHFYKPIQHSPYLSKPPVVEDSRHKRDDFDDFEDYSAVHPRFVYKFGRAWDIPNALNADDILNHDIFSIRSGKEDGYFFDLDDRFEQLETLNCSSAHPVYAINNVLMYEVKLPNPRYIADCFTYTSSFTSFDCGTLTSLKCPLTLQSIKIVGNTLSYDTLCGPSPNDTAFYSAARLSSCFSITDLMINDRTLIVGPSSEANFSPYVHDGYRMGFVSPFCLVLLRYILRQTLSVSSAVSISNGAALSKCPQGVLWFKNTWEIHNETVKTVDVAYLPFEMFHGDGIYYQDCVANMAVCFRIVDLPGMDVRFHQCPPECGAYKPITRSKGFMDWLSEFITDILPSVEALADFVTNFLVLVLGNIIKILFVTILGSLLKPVFMAFLILLKFKIFETIILILISSRVMPWVFAVFSSFGCWVVMVWLERTT